MKGSGMDLKIMTGRIDFREYKRAFQTSNLKHLFKPILVSNKYLFQVKTGIILVDTYIGPCN